VTTASCDVNTQLTCEFIGGTFRGTGTTCATIVCPIVGPTGACCVADVCSITTSAQCAVLAGIYLGDGSVCGGVACERGACCLPDGTCIEVNSVLSCQFIGGTYQGAGTTCAMIICPQPQVGACCTGPGLTMCSITTQAACAGFFAGVGTTCGIPSNPVICCRANYNGVDGVTVQDIFDFLADWNTAVNGGMPTIGNPDFNGDLMVTVQDIFDFLATWNAGCP
jgi:hypothetical protein